VDEHEDLLYAIVAKGVAKCYLNYNPIPCSKKPSNCQKMICKLGLYKIALASSSRQLVDPMRKKAHIKKECTFTQTAQI
jgi:hypothetical protein